MGSEMIVKFVFLRNTSLRGRSFVSNSKRMEEKKEIKIPEAELISFSSVLFCEERDCPVCLLEF